MALIGTLWMYGLRARLHRGSTLLFDRWIDDGLIDLDLRFPDFRRRRSWLARGAERWAARPDLQVLLVAPDEVMTARRAAKDEPFPDPPERWRGRVAAYRALAPTRPDIVVIDAAGPLEDVADRVWREVAPRLGPR
jgi:thymidylate kinase